jgi:hypothetical protein
MKPLINMEETPDKVVGRRKVPHDSFKSAMDLQKLAGALQKSLGLRFVPKGAFRFKTHEEADEWMLTMLARGQES